MEDNAKIKKDILENTKLKLTERDCPRCDAILIHNSSEACYECLNCGYIDCGDE